MKPAKKLSPKSSKRPAAARQAAGFTSEEKDAMRERAAEAKAAARRASSSSGVDGERDLLEKIAAMPPADRVMAERIHAIVTANAPALAPKTWYGMPAYARDGSVVCFFQSAHKFKSRYATLGFTGNANLDDGRMWPCAFAIIELTPDEEARIAALVRKAAG